MKITVINKRPTGGDKVQCIDGVSVAPGEQHEMNSRSNLDVTFQIGAIQDDDIAVIAEREGEDLPYLVCDMKAPADPVADTFVLAGEGFDIEDEAGAAASVTTQMYLGVFDDEDCQTPSVNGTLDTAATGTINEGAGTHLLKITPDAGVASVTLTATGAGEFWLKAWPVGTDRIIDGTDVHKTTFTAS